ncbi:MAG: hypothetical protein QM398_00070 [Thermoproteota archaeon]|nr:hypothetical protein [Thermoproteota archaeon]
MSVNHCYACSTALIAVKTCSKTLLALCLVHGKSPCFSEVAFLLLLGVDARASKVVSIHGAEFLECAFCYGRQ